ncbi:MAG: fibronectin type III domain-containing protein [Ilumatobacteraceae bacterium]
MRSKLTRVVAVAAAVAAASVGLISASASALPPGSASSGAVTVAPSSGTGATVITLTPPAGAACAGDSATGGYRWQTFIASASVDVGTLTYTSSGPSAVAGAVTAPLLSSGGTPVVNQTTSVGTALLTGIPTFAFAGFPAGFFPNGAYNIGFACTLAGATTSFWTAPITVNNAAGFAYSFGAVPAAPVLTSVTPGNASLAGAFTEAAATPAVTGYTVTAVPTAGATVTLPLAAGATTFTLTGLVNGTQYAVSLIATNTVGNSPASNTVNGTPSLPGQPAPGVSAVPGANQVTINITAPVGETATRTGYTLAVSPTVAGSPFSVAAAATSFTVTGLTPGTTYTFTLTATYAAPDFGTPAVTSAAPTSSAVITQEIDVTRPVGGLVLTQVCNRFGALDAEAAIGGYFPAFGAVPTFDAGTAPTLDPVVGGAGDPLYPQYPYPVNAAGDSIANYPTHCGLHLATPTLITTGAEAGKYFRTDGRLNQVTIADTRDGDAGWSVTGQVTNFDVIPAGGTHPATCDSTATCFNGNYLTWTPKKTSDSGPTLEGYDQNASAGPAMLTEALGTGLHTAPQTLGLAPVNAGLGIAVFDAHLRLLIPVTANAGVYRATLTLSAG